jgi:hypothetical protein
MNSPTIEYAASSLRVPLQTRRGATSLAKLRHEALENSQAAPVFEMLTSTIGPRLTASPTHKRPAEFVRDRLAGYRHPEKSTNSGEAPGSSGERSVGIHHARPHGTREPDDAGALVAPLNGAKQEAVSGVALLQKTGLSEAVPVVAQTATIQ